MSKFAVILPAAGKSSRFRDPHYKKPFAPFLPPFRLRGDVLSPDVPELSARLDEKVVFANSYVLFEPFADVYGGWGTRGRPADTRDEHVSVSEAYRFTALPTVGSKMLLPSVSSVP